MKILHTLASLPVGGVGAYLKSIYENIDSEKYKMEFVVATDERTGVFLDIAATYNWKVHFVSRICLKNFSKIKNEFKELFKHNHFDVVEIQSINMAFLLAATAKKANAKIVMHGHNTAYSHKALRSIRNYILTIPIKHWADKYIACGKLVAKKLFIARGVKNEDIFIMPNPIAPLKINPPDEQFRLKFCTDKNQKVCAAIGNLLAAKNHGYLLKVFKKLQESGDNCKLLIAGEGVLREELAANIKKEGIVNVELIGYCKDVPKLINNVDVVLMPSLYEGLPVVTMEVQSLGVPMILSNKITQEIKVNDNIAFLPIDDKSVDLWANKIKEFCQLPRENPDKFNNSIYNISNAINSLEEFYSELVTEECCE